MPMSIQATLIGTIKILSIKMQVFKGKWKNVEYLMTVYNFSPTHQHSISLTGNTYSYVQVCRAVHFIIIMEMQIQGNTKEPTTYNRHR